MRQELYFAYGSNMDLRQMNTRVPNHYQVIVAGNLDSYEWFINNRGYANIARKQDTNVYGVLFNISRTGLHNLDRYEGYPNLYIRRRLAVNYADQILKPWVYIDINNTSMGTPRESYLELVIISAMKFKLPHQHIAHLANFLPY